MHDLLHAAEHRQIHQLDLPAAVPARHPTAGAAGPLEQLAFGIVNVRHYRLRALLYAGRPNWDLLDGLTSP